MRSSPVCIDANLVVYHVAGSRDDANASAVRKVWRDWSAERRRLVAPRLFTYKVTNALSRLGMAQMLTAESIERSLAAARSLPIGLFHDGDLHSRAIPLASLFHHPAAYDAPYLAPAERLGAEFWTADQRLANSVRPHLRWVRLLGD